VEREYTLSTLGQPQMEWKQEVNRRLAAHRNRKGSQAASRPMPAPHALGSSRAAEAAARVAARYAHAPSYSQMQAEEARVAVRAAEIATQVALEAQAAAQDALAELHAAIQPQPMRGPAVVQDIARAIRAGSTLPGSSVEDRTQPAEDAAPAAEPAAAGNPFDTSTEPLQADASPQPELRPVTIRWEPDIPVRILRPNPAPQEQFELAAEDWWTPAQVSETLRSEPIAVEPQPAHANLIEFPRELVATRRMRPRLAETPFLPRSGEAAQLSIFEVDPGSISTELPAAIKAEPLSSTGPEWSGIQLDEHPATESVKESEGAVLEGVFLAPFRLRLLSSVVDASLILAAFFAAGFYLVSRIPHPPVGKPAEIVAVGGLILAGLLYHALFCTVGISTPGMRYAGIALSTFNDESPTRAQMRRRFGAMVLSLAPVGLGFAWSIFDEDHLAWHDRISRTYLRKR